MNTNLSPANADRKPYQAPALSVHGNLSSITLLTGKGKVDDGIGKADKT